MKAWWSGLVVAVLSACLAACGGGGGDEPRDTTLPDQTVTTTYTISGDFRSANGGVVNTHVFTQGVPVTVRAQVVEVKTIQTPGQADRITRNPAVGKVVTFTTEGGAITPESGTALTDGEGDARVTLTPGNRAGAYSLTMSTEGVSKTINYQVGTTQVPALTLEMLGANGSAISDIEAGSVATLRITARRVETEADGTPTGELAPAEDVLVTVGSDGGTFDPSNGTVLTDGEGVALARMRANVEQGGFTVTATAMIDNLDVAVTKAFRITVPDVRVGAGSPFQQGFLDVGQPTIGAGGTTSVSMRLVTVDGAPFTPPVPVTFTSGCAANGEASLTSPVMSANGEAISTYTAGGGCVGTDTIVGEALIPGTSLPLTAAGVVSITPPSAGSIAFVSAEPSSIALRGHATSELPETTEVKFRVLSASGVPVPSQLVQFTLSTVAGGLAVQESSGVSDSAGEVTTHVHAGTVATVFRVVATLDGTDISTQSQGISVSTGSPDQAGFSVSAETLNPEAGNYDGVTVPVQIRASDWFRNPVADGTVVQFTASGGAVTPSCTTVNGGCSVTWTAQNPRPANGRAVILAFTAGDETFVDLDGDGRFSAGDTWQDLPEAWLDANENGRHDPGEFFVDADGNGAYSPANGRYDGALCDVTSNLCGGVRSVDVRSSITIVMATSDATVSVSPAHVSLAPNASGTVRIHVSDRNGNLPPEGTQISVTTSKGQLSGTTSWTVGNSNARGPFTGIVTVQADDVVGTGTISVEVRTPGGTVSNGQGMIEVTNTTTDEMNEKMVEAQRNAIAETAVRLEVWPRSISIAEGAYRKQIIHVSALDGAGQRVPYVVTRMSCSASDGLVANSGDHASQTLERADALQIAYLQAARGAAGARGECVIESAHHRAIVSIVAKAKR